LAAVTDVTGVASSTRKLWLITSELFGDTGDVTMALGLDVTAGGSEALFGVLRRSFIGLDSRSIALCALRRVDVTTALGLDVTPGDIRC